ncbi:hypothetical protein ACTXT7_005043 [Hymenolepis weldensis]
MAVGEIVPPDEVPAGIKPLTVNPEMSKTPSFQAIKLLALLYPKSEDLRVTEYVYLIKVQKILCLRDLIHFKGTEITATGKAPSELEVRGQMLQLADLLSWDAKCNRVLHDLVVSCYGAPAGPCPRN